MTAHSSVNGSLAVRPGSGARIPSAYVRMLVEDGHQNPPAFLHAVAEMFNGVDLDGRNVLEIGSGRGLLSIYTALRGAAQVTSLEPELVGATSGVITAQKRRIEALGLSNIEVISADFNSWDAGAARFDVIFARSTINHLYESDKHALRDAPTYDNYVRVARKIHGLLAPGGVFIATDACRYAFFTAARRFGIRRPWRWKRSGIDWRYHQNPRTWTRIFEHAGFSRTHVDYPVPYRLRQLGPVVNTAGANFFLHGAFILRGWH